MYIAQLAKHVVHIKCNNPHPKKLNNNNKKKPNVNFGMVRTVSCTAA